MSRIITNVQSMLAQRVLGQQNQGLNTALERLSTGLRINRGADDPAGLIASENLRAEKASITAAIGNAERADQVVNIAEGGLQEVSTLLTELESLVDQSANKAGLSAEERQANQLQIDAVLQTIDRIANSTSFQGVKLLNGTYAYTTSASTTDLNKLAEIHVNAAKIPDSGFIGVNLTVAQSAQVGTVVLSTGPSAVISGSSLSIEVAGNKGTQQFTFGSGSSATSVAAAINSFKEVTGVSASVSGSDVYFSSTGFGSAQFVSVKKLAGDDAYDTSIYKTNDSLTQTGAGSKEAKDFGRDATVSINGTTATADGLKARVASSSLDIELTLDLTANTNGATATLNITGGGATFQLAPKLDLAGKVSLGIDSVTTGNLGSVTNGFLSELAAGGSASVTGTADNSTTAQNIVRDAIKQVSSLRGRLGAFQKYTVGATIRSLGVTLENTSAAESQIRDADFAKETAGLTRQQILVQAATQVLSIANAKPQSVLGLLG